MIEPSTVEAVLNANRDLNREQLSRFGHELPWLSDPDEIPESALSHATENGDLADQCASLSTWMLTEICQWTIEGQSRLSWGETFERHQIPNEYRVRIRERMMVRPHTIYLPGLMAMSEMVAVSPLVGARDGVDKSEWGTVAANSRKLGAAISRDGTDSQFFMRRYLHERISAETGESVKLRYLNPAKLKLDAETGLATVTPLPELIAVIKKVVERDISEAAKDPSSGVCVALQAKSPIENKDAKNMFDAVWLAYAAGAGRLIYPNFEIHQHEIPVQDLPDPNVAARIEASVGEHNATIEKARAAAR